MSLLSRIAGLFRRKPKVLTLHYSVEFPWAPYWQARDRIAQQQLKHASKQFADVVLEALQNG